MDDPTLWASIFTPDNLRLAFFGALGGAIRALALRTTWREGLRVILVGGGTAFGTGVVAPSLIAPYFGSEAAAGASGTLNAAAFLLGLIAVTLVERALDKRGSDS